MNDAPAIADTFGLLALVIAIVLIYMYNKYPPESP